MELQKVDVHHFSRCLETGCQPKLATLPAAGQSALSSIAVWSTRILFDVSSSPSHSWASLKGLQVFSERAHSSSSPLTTHERNQKRKGCRIVLDFSMEGISRFSNRTVGILPSLHGVYAYLTANKLEHTTKSYLRKLIYTKIYRLVFTKTLKNWISYHIIRFYEIIFTAL